MYVTGIEYYLVSIANDCCLMCVTGSEYYLASIAYDRQWPEQAMVIGVENMTNVRIQFPSTPSIDVEYDGKTYSSNDVLILTIDKYETFQFTSDYGMVCTVAATSNIIIMLLLTKPLSLIP